MYDGSKMWIREWISSRTYDHLYHMCVLCVCSSFWRPFVWHGQKPRLLFSIPPCLKKNGVYP